MKKFVCKLHGYIVYLILRLAIWTFSCLVSPGHGVLGNWENCREKGKGLKKKENDRTGAAKNSLESLLDPM